MPGIIGSLVLIALIGYLWGSIPAGYWMGKLLRGKDFDIRDYGSHKTGMTNVLRTLGKGPAIVVGVIDISKGIGAALIAPLVPFFIDPLFSAMSEGSKPQSAISQSSRSRPYMTLSRHAPARKYSPRWTPSRRKPARSSARCSARLSTSVPAWRRFAVVVLKAPNVE